MIERNYPDWLNIETEPALNYPDQFYTEEIDDAPDEDDEEGAEQDDAV